MIETIVKKEIKRYEAENGEIVLTEEDLSLEYHVFAVKM